MHAGPSAATWCRPLLLRDVGVVTLFTTLVVVAFDASGKTIGGADVGVDAFRRVSIWNETAGSEKVSQQRNPIYRLLATRKATVT